MGWVKDKVKAYREYEAKREADRPRRQEMEIATLKREVEITKLRAQKAKYSRDISAQGRVSSPSNIIGSFGFPSAPSRKEYVPSTKHKKKAYRKHKTRSAVIREPKNDYSVFSGRGLF